MAKLQPNRKGGRPTKFKDNLLADAQTLGGLGFTEEELATYWSISSRTLNRWKHRNPELCQAIKKGQMNANISVTRSMYGQANRGNMTAVIFWLTNRCPELWRDRRALVNLKQDIVSQGNTAVSNQMTDGEVRQVINQFTPDQKRELITTFKGMQEKFKRGGESDGKCTDSPVNTDAEQVKSVDSETPNPPSVLGSGGEHQV